MPNTRSTSDAHSSSIDQLTAALGNLLTRTAPVAMDSLRPPIYEVGDNFSDWRVQAERYLVHLPADQRIDHITGLLGPTAKRRLNYLCVSPPTTISNLWATLENLFGAQEPLIALHNKFCLRTQQPGEDADSYLDALFSLGSRVFSESQVSDQVFLRFVGGLRSEDIKREFRIRPPADLLTALQTTKIFESTPPHQEPRRAPSSPQGQPRVSDRRPSFSRVTNPNDCWYCQQFKDRARKCGHNNLAGKTPPTLLPSISSSLPTDLPLTVTGTLDGTPATILIDTGAIRSVLRSPHIPITHSPPSDIQLVTADGSPLRCTGTRQVSIVLPICSVVHPMLVSPDIRVDAIVGLDFLRAHQLIIDPNNPAAVLLPRSAISNISVDVSTLDTTPPNEPTSIDDLLTRQEVPVTYLRRLKDTLLPFQRVFTWAGQPIGRTGLVQHEINTGTAAPQRQPARRIPIHYQTELNGIISDLLAQGIIEPSKSPWAAPVTLVKKKDGHLRLCIDYRQLNKVTVRDSFPIPRIDDTIDALAGASWFASLDLSHSYWQIEVRPEHRHKTAFILPTGLYQFNTLPMGLANATATCQRLMQFVLRTLLPQSCLVYLDDIIIHGRSVSHLLQNLSLVLQKLQAAGLTINPKKCHFLQRQVTYLGHVVDETGITPDPEKIRQVLDWATPQSQTDVRSFLGLASYYRRFIYGFANIALPLHRLTEKGRSFVWTAECTQAFLTLKNALTSAPILALPDGDVQSPPFILDTDASGFAIGAVLSQIGTDGHEHIIAYASQCLDKVQRHYSTTRREMLALATFVKKFRHLLLAKHFIVRTDHQALKWLRNFKDAEGQVARWRELLEEFDFQVQYRPGKRHNNADTLSRPPLSPTKVPNDALPVAAIHMSQAAQEQWAQMQASDPNVSIIYDRQLHGSPKPSAREMESLSWEAHCLWSMWPFLRLVDNILFFQHHPSLPKRLVVPRNLRAQVIRATHEELAHCGQAKTLTAVRQRYWWPDQRRDVVSVCQTCQTCAQIKDPVVRPRAPLEPMSAGFPNHRIGLDIIGPLFQTKKGNRFILVIVDYFTKWCEAIPLPNSESLTVAAALVDHWITRYGSPYIIHTDQGTAFENYLFRALCHILGIVKTRSSPFHPAGNGQTERTNKTLVSFLRSMVDQSRADSWDDLLPRCLLAYRATIHSSTSFSPHMMLFGRDLRLPSDVTIPHGTPEMAQPHRYLEQLIDSLQTIHTTARTKLQAAHSHQKDYYDHLAHGTQYEPGDRVWLHNDHAPAGFGSKFHRQWSGPYIVLRPLSNSVCRIRLESDPFGRIIQVHFNRLKPCLSEYQPSQHPVPSTSHPTASLTTLYTPPCVCG
ncbi:hypothetical protein SprV_0301285600 [Sparganum proliferum]